MPLSGEAVRGLCGHPDTLVLSPLGVGADLGPQSCSEKIINPLASHVVHRLRESQIGRFPNSEAVQTTT